MAFKIYHKLNFRGSLNFLTLKPQNEVAVAVLYIYISNGPDKFSV